MAAPGGLLERPIPPPPPVALGTGLELIVLWYVPISFKVQLTSEKLRPGNLLIASEIEVDQ